MDFYGTQELCAKQLKMPQILICPAYCIGQPDNYVLRFRYTHALCTKRGPPLEFIIQRGYASRFHQPKRDPFNHKGGQPLGTISMDLAVHQIFPSWKPLRVLLYKTCSCLAFYIIDYHDFQQRDIQRLDLQLPPFTQSLTSLLNNAMHNTVVG